MSQSARTNWPAVIVLVLVGVAAALEFAKISVVFDAVANTYGADAAGAAWFVSLPALFTILFGLTGSVVAERIGFRRTILASLALAVLLSVIQAFTPPLPVFLATRVLDGAVQLGIVVACPVLILQFARPSHRAFAMSMWGSFFGTAFVVAGVASPAIVDAFGVGAGYLAHALVAGALWLVIRFWLPRVPGDGPQPGVSGDGFIRTHVTSYRMPRAVLPGAIFIFHTALYAVFVLFVPTFVDASVTPILLVWMPLVSILGTLGAGVLTGRLVSPPVVLIAGFAGVIVCMGAIVALGAVRELAVALPLALMTCSGLIQGASFSLMPALSVDPDVTARANGVLMQLGNLGTLVGPPLFAAVMLAGPGNGVLPFALLTLVCAAVAGCIAAVAMRLTGARPVTA